MSTEEIARLVGHSSNRDPAACRLPGLSCYLDMGGGDNDGGGSWRTSGAGKPRVHPAAIRAVLAANADPETVRRFDADLDAAFEQSRCLGDLTPLVDTVRHWWFEADSWRDALARSEYQARVSRYLADAQEASSPG